MTTTSPSIQPTDAKLDVSVKTVRCVHPVLDVRRLVGFSVYQLHLYSFQYRNLLMTTLMWTRTRVVDTKRIHSVHTLQQMNCFLEIVLQPCDQHYSTTTWRELVAKKRKCEWDSKHRNNQHYHSTDFTRCDDDDTDCSSRWLSPSLSFRRHVKKMNWTANNSQLIHFCSLHPDDHS